MIRIGSRGSKLALWQACHVQALLQKAGLSSEIKIIKTEGDENQISPLKEIGGKGLFTQALDEAMLAGEIDLAVHSTKDIPTELEKGFSLISFLKREDPRDVLLALSKEVDLDNYSRKFVIGTSSTRRQALLQYYSPQVTARSIRGNVDTRISKMEAGQYDGIILAYAGVKRLGLEKYIIRKLNVTTFTPAIGQGAVGVVAMNSSLQNKKIREVLNHKETELTILCERAFLRRLEGGCSTPAFGLATLIGDTISFSAGLAEEDGSKIYRGNLDGAAENPEELGESLANIIIQQRGSN